jgi:hypothetical protein
MQKVSGMIHKGKTFSKARVVLDNNDYDACLFQNCMMVFKGGTPPGLRGCRFEGCTFMFEDAAQNTFRFLALLYTQGNKELIEGIFDDLRGGKAN